MVDSVPTTEFGDAARSMRDRKLAVANWIKVNEKLRPNLVRAGKVIIYKLLSHIPLSAPCLPLDRCVELSPSYIAKVAETSPQTARNAWMELRVLLGWKELSTRAKIGNTLKRIGYEPRYPSGGRRWGTHVFIFSKLYAAVQSISEWLKSSGRYMGVSCVPENQKIESSIVRIVKGKLSNTNINLDNYTPPCSPPKTKRKPRDESRRNPWRCKGWSAKTKKEQMGELFSFMLKVDDKKISPDARRRCSWLDKMSKIPPRFRYGLYRPGESIKSPNGELAMCLIAEVNAAYGRVLQIDVADTEDEWFGYNLMVPNVIEKHINHNCSLGAKLDMYGEEVRNHAMPTISNDSRCETGFEPKELGDSSSFLWAESKKSIWPKYEILTDKPNHRTKCEMLGIVWGNGPSPPCDISDNIEQCIA